MKKKIKTSKNILKIFTGGNKEISTTSTSKAATTRKYLKPV